jgi:hypothetical protein
MDLQTMKGRIPEKLITLALVILAVTTAWSLLDSSPFFACRPISQLENEPLAHGFAPADAKCYYVARGGIHFESDPISNGVVATVSLTLFLAVIVLYAAYRRQRNAPGDAPDGR